MSQFTLQSGSLYCEDVSLADIAAKHGTPTYVYSAASIDAAFREYQTALYGRPHLICYAVKANSNLAILNRLARLGAGFDVVSGGELERVIRAGGDAGKVVFSGVGKTRSELALALDRGIRCFNIESESELRQLADIAGELGKTAPVSIRINPDVDAGTHPYISTGLRENKFGVDASTARRLYMMARDSDALNPMGLDCHIGSQILDINPFLESVDFLTAVINDLSKEGIKLSHLDVGGGLGVSYETPAPKIDDYIAALLDRLSTMDLELILEPGRSIVAMAGALLTKVEYLKPTSQRHFAIVDAAMNDLLRPALYGAWQEICPVKPRSGEVLEWDVVGPVCETADFLGKARPLSLSEGDLLSIMGAGAYGYSMTSNYNSRPRAAEVLVEGATTHLISERESVDALWQREFIPPEGSL
ncbi:MAG: diaminopimelate decarboxylase [Halieaceae bacterium]|nr:diaminopimelate decarboxylase [Halieaceae bacterium]